MLGFNLDALCGSPGSRGDVILRTEISERSPQVGTDHTESSRVPWVGRPAPEKIRPDSQRSEHLK